MNYKLTIILLVGIIFYQGNTYCQNLNETDSLELALTLENDPEKKVDILLALVNISRSTNSDLALEFANQAVDIANKSNNLEKKTRAWIIIANIYNRKSDYLSSMKYANKAKNLAKEIGLEKEYAMSLNMISMSYYNHGNYVKSSELNFDALKIVEKLGDKKGILNMLNRIGSDYSAQENYDKAFEYYSRSLAIARELNDMIGIAQGLNNLSTVLYTRKEYDKFEIYIKEVIEINKKTGRKLWEGINYLNLGMLYTEIDLFDSSYYYLSKALSIFIEINNVPNIASCQLELSRYYDKIGNSSGSLEQSLMAYNLAQSNNLKKQIQEAAGLLQHLYVVNHDFTNAYKYSRIELHTKDSLDIESSKTRLSQLEMMYEFEKLEQENIRKQQQRELTYIISVIIIVFVFILLIIILITRNRIKKKNEEIERRRLMSELEIKNKELTTNVMYSIQKNNMLTALVEELVDIRKTAIKEETQNAIHRISNKIQKSLKSNAWEEFELRFQQVHNDFYNNLSKKFPELTPNEKRLCAFLRLDMSSKEISKITGQSVSALEMARVRLRKKLGIANKNVNLITFLCQF